MRKKIFMSLFTIAVVGAMMTGGAIAYFSDVEESGQNVFEAGTIDIEVDGENPWSGSFSLEDMKPSEVGYLSFEVTNIGTNKVALYKHIKNVATDGGILAYPEGAEVASSEPEYEAGGGDSGYTETCPLDAYIDYDMKVFDYDDEGNFIGERTIFPKPGEDCPTIREIKSTYVFLGLLPPGCTMSVVQSYHLQDVGNWAQGDRMTFTIEIYAQQLDGHLRLENKDDNGWKIVTDDMWGRLMYMQSWPTFVYEFDGYGLQFDTDYTLIIHEEETGAWNDENTYLGNGTTDGSGNLELMGSVDLSRDLTDVKIWLVPTADLDPTTLDFITWHNDLYLYETQLISYDDTDVP